MVSLKGFQVDFVVSDPWAFPEENSGSSIEGVVEESNESDVLLRSAVPFRVEGHTYGYLLCGIRHEGESMEQLAAGESVACNGIGVPEGRLAEARSLDGSWYRGVGGVLGSLKRK